LASAFDDPSLNPDLVGWATELIERVATDDTDARIGRMTFVESRGVGFVAAQVGLAEKTVRNRITAIRQAVREALDVNEQA